MATSVESVIRPVAIDDRNRESDFRAAFTSLVGPSPSSSVSADGGILPSAYNAEATSTGTTGAPKTTVQPFALIIPSLTQYGWVCRQPTAVQLDHAAPNPTNPRIDLVVAKVLSGSLWVETVAGTPAGSPVAPSAPADSVTLWQVSVPTSGVLAYTDKRTWTSAAGGLRLSTNNTSRVGAYSGEARVSATGQVEIWNGLAWVAVASPAQWASETPVLRYAGGAGGVVNLGSGGSATCRYIKLGSTLRVRYEFVWGTSGWNGGTGGIFTRLPASLVSSSSGGDSRILCHLWVKASTTSNPSAINYDWSGTALVVAGDSSVNPMFPINVDTTRMGFYTIAVTAAVPGQSTPLIPSGYAEGGRLNIWGEVEVG